MTVHELRLALADYPGEAAVLAVDGSEVDQVELYGTAAEVLEASRAYGLSGAHLETLQSMLRLCDPGTVFLGISHYA